VRHEADCANGSEPLTELGRIGGCVRVMKSASLRNLDRVRKIPSSLVLKAQGLINVIRMHFGWLKSMLIIFLILETCINLLNT